MKYVFFLICLAMPSYHRVFRLGVLTPSHVVKLIEEFHQERICIGVDTGNSRCPCSQSVWMRRRRSVISLHTPTVRVNFARIFFDLMRKLTQCGFFEKANVNDLSAILGEIEGWLEAEARLNLIWDEGCAHEGWFEWILPPHTNRPR